MSKAILVGPKGNELRIEMEEWPTGVQCPEVHLHVQEGNVGIGTDRNGKCVIELDGPNRSAIYDKEQSQ